MKTLSISIALWAAFMWVAQAQTTLFNQLYYTDTTSMGSVAGLVTNNGYLIAGDVNAASGYSAFYTRKIDFYGNDLGTVVVQGGTQYSTMIFGNSMIYGWNNDIVLTGVKGSSSFNTDVFVVAINTSNTILWSNTYETSNETEGNAMVLKTTNGSYLIVGWTATYNVNSGTNGPSKIYLLKITSNGIYEWSQKIGINATPLHCEQTQDGGFILSGYRYSNATGYDMYVVKTDSLGNLQWSQTYGTQHNDGGCLVKQTESGDYVLIGVISEESGIKKQLYYTRIDAEGSIIDGIERFHSKNNNYGIEASFILLPNNNIITATISFGPPPIWELAFAIISPEGEIILETPISSGIGGEDYIRDIEPTPDGGYLLVGFNYTSPAKSWVIKVDSLGNTCGIAPCSSTVYPVGIAPTPQGSKPTPAAIYPNPVPVGSSTAQISYTLPPQLPFGVWELYDVQGQKVRYQVLPAGSSPSQTQTLDLSGLPAGMYVWRLALPGGYEQHEASGKLIVQ